jgi:DnaK suppressor protein
MKEHAMKSETAMRFKAIFEAQRRDLMRTQAVIHADLSAGDESLVDELDLTALERERELRLKLRSREAVFLRKIEEALQRISDGSFGSCAACGEEIDERRLEARPTASHCFECKERQERAELSFIDGNKGLRRLRLA